MTKILDLEHIQNNVKDRKLFMGHYSGYQRFDQYKYQDIKSLEFIMRKAYWTPEEVNLTQARINFKTLPQHHQDILTVNLLFQTLMDSVNSRSLDLILSQLTTSNELEALFKTQAFFELIHSFSYSHIIREVFPNATAEFDKLYNIPEITNRLTGEVELFNIYSTGKYYLLSHDEKRHYIVKILLKTYILESIKFYVSFLITYAIDHANDNKILPISHIIKLINFDEDKHVDVFSKIINILTNNKDEGFSDIFKSDWYNDLVISSFKQCYEDELEWGKFLLSYGRIPSITIEVLETFIKYWIDERLGRINQPKIYNEKSSDIITWFNLFRDVDKDNTAFQEGDGLAYNIGILVNDLTENKLTYNENIK